MKINVRDMMGDNCTALILTPNSTLHCLPAKVEPCTPCIL